jgi:hypothetical protein
VDVSLLPSPAPIAAMAPAIKIHFVDLSFSFLLIPHFVEKRQFLKPAKI